MPASKAPTPTSSRQGGRLTASSMTPEIGQIEIENMAAEAEAQRAKAEVAANIKLAQDYLDAMTSGQFRYKDEADDARKAFDTLAAYRDVFPSHPRLRAMHEAMTAMKPLRDGGKSTTPVFPPAQWVVVAKAMEQNAGKPAIKALWSSLNAPLQEALTIWGRTEFTGTRIDRDKATQTLNAFRGTYPAGVADQIKTLSAVMSGNPKAPPLTANTMKALIDTDIDGDLSHIGTPEEQRLVQTMRVSMHVATGNALERMDIRPPNSPANGISPDTRDQRVRSQEDLARDAAIHANSRSSMPESETHTMTEPEAPAAAPASGSADPQTPAGNDPAAEATSQAPPNPAAAPGSTPGPAPATSTPAAGPGAAASARVQAAPPERPAALDRDSVQLSAAFRDGNESAAAKMAQEERAKEERRRAEMEKFQREMMQGQAPGGGGGGSLPGLGSLVRAAFTGWKPQKAKDQGQTEPGSEEARQNLLRANSISVRASKEAILGGLRQMDTASTILDGIAAERTRRIEQVATSHDIVARTSADGFPGNPGRLFEVIDAAGGDPSRLAMPDSPLKQHMVDYMNATRDMAKFTAESGPKIQAARDLGLAGASQVNGHGDWLEQSGVLNSGEAAALRDATAGGTRKLDGIDQKSDAAGYDRRSPEGQESTEKFAEAKKTMAELAKKIMEMIKRLFGRGASPNASASPAP